MFVPVDLYVSELTSKLNSFRESSITPAEEDYYSNRNELSPCWRMRRRGSHPCPPPPPPQTNPSQMREMAPDCTGASSIFPWLGRSSDPHASPPSKASLKAVEDHLELN